MGIGGSAVVGWSRLGARSRIGSSSQLARSTFPSQSVSFKSALTKDQHEGDRPPPGWIEAKIQSCPSLETIFCRCFINKKMSNVSFHTDFGDISRVALFDYIKNLGEGFFMFVSNHQPWFQPLFIINSLTKPSNSPKSSNSILTEMNFRRASAATRLGPSSGRSSLTSTGNYFLPECHPFES